tara:strand:+ start:173 stop:466 length:294 start_codon:yes stop_codon:yes gene_type:complete
MRQISVDEAQVGDVIAAPVENDQGRVLLPVGAKLSAAVLSRLKGWGVETLAVEGEESAADGGAQGGALVEALEHRFAGFEDDSLMMQIKDIARSHLP